MEKPLYITLHTISARPGNPVVETDINIFGIYQVNVTMDDEARIGAGAAVVTLTGMLLVKESIEDIRAAIASKLQTVV
jgi:hypothetical protein